MPTKEKSGGSSAVGIGAGVLAAGAAIAAGYYFYASKDAKKHRKIVADWALDFKKEVLKEVSKIKKVGKAPMMQAIDKATKLYEVGRNINREDIAIAAKELKGNWETLLQEVRKSATTAKKEATKTVKKPLSKKKSK